MDKIYGYRRANGTWGIRNYVAVIPTVFCANHSANLIAEKFERAIAFPHPVGCGQFGKDLQQTINTLSGIGKNPNFGAVLIVGLGCERIRAKDLSMEISKSKKPVRYINIQENGGTLKTIEDGIRIVRDFDIELAAQKKELFPVSELIIGLKCGGTDATSGIAANPALGLAVDHLINNGGTAFISEIAELLGAEHMLKKRSITPEVYNQIEAKLKYVENFLNSMTKNYQRTSAEAALVTPGNFEGGVSSVSEKALSSVQKAGNCKISGVLEYAERPKHHGMFFMAAIGGDADVVTSLVAGGAQLIAFTTGLGTPTGFPGVPVIKITGNSMTYKKMIDDIDINVGNIMDGTQSLNEMGEYIYNMILQVASGKPTKAEILKHDELYAIGRYIC